MAMQKGEQPKRLAQQDLEGTIEGRSKARGGVHWMEEVIDQARRRGDFDNLPGRGRPLALDPDDPYAGPDAQAYKILKDAGFKPEWVELRGKITAEINWIRSNPTHPERPSRIVETNILIQQHNRLIPNPTLSLPKLPSSFPNVD